MNNAINLFNRQRSSCVKLNYYSIVTLAVYMKCIKLARLLKFVNTRIAYSLLRLETGHQTEQTAN